MNKNLNIEELFKQTLENAEFNPGDGVWSTIQTKLAAKAATNTAAVSGATKVSFSVTKIIGLSGLSAVIITSAVLIINNFNNHENTDKLSTEKPVPVETNKPAVLIEKNDFTETEVIVLNKENSQTPPEKIKVTIKQSDLEKPNNNQSYAQTWLTPDYVKEKLMGQQNNKKEEIKNTATTSPNISTEDNSLKTNTNNNNTIHNTVIITDNISQEKLVASIVSNVSGGPAPLVVNFSNIENASSYVWNFGDGKMSTEPNPTHIFEKAGTYQVTLQIKDKNGNSSSAKAKIEVKASSAIEIVNVFSPNSDGINDFFEAKIKENIEVFSIQVITTDGKKTIFTSNEVNFKWDGRDMSGNLYPAGNYIYIGKAMGKDGKEYNLSGMVTLVR